MVMIRYILESKFVFIVLALIAALIGGGIRLYYSINPDTKAIKASLLTTGRDRVNILFIGVDDVEGTHRADTIALASFDLNNRGIGAISIPRDTRVRVPGRGWTKINHAYAYGGVRLLKETLKEFLAIPIDHYVKIDYKGFINLIDLIGGVELYVEKNMRYVDKWGGLYINLKKGYQKLNGKKALEYVRFRHDPEGDIGRIKRQWKFLKAVVRKLKSQDMWKRLPSIAVEAVKVVKTDLTPEQLIYIASLFRGIDFSRIRWGMVPGRPAYIDGISYWLPDLNALERLKKWVIWGEGPSPKDIKREITVEVLNGNGLLGAASKVRKILEGYGYRVIKVGNADRLDYSITKIVDNTGRNLEVAKRIVKILGYGVAISERRKDSSFSITIILGKDMKE
ncbi:MAG: LCP family protein [Synergistetes bacterium]|nr:LCP family protein [Synergistota bacterium]